MSFPIRKDLPAEEPESMAHELEGFTKELKDYVRSICRDPPAEPCAEELHYFDIPMNEWRRALEDWLSRQNGGRSYSLHWIRGFRHAIRDFEDEELLVLIEELGR